MTALSIQPTYPIFTDIDGQPLEDGYVWLGVANLAPIVNPITVYWDAALTIPAVQPVRTRGGYPINSGTPARLYVNSDYSIQVQNRNGSVVYSAPAATERYSGVVVSVNASDVAYTPVNDVATNVAAFLDFFIGHGGDGELTNTRVGEDALRINTSGTNNTAVGKKAMELNTTGYQNTAVGVDAMFQNDTGHYNTAVGEGSMMENTTGTDNTAIGHSANKFAVTGSFNTALGKAAMHDGSNGNSNTAVGYRSNYYADTGAANVMVGAQSGEYTNTGSNNTFVGYQTGLANSTSSNNTFVGSNAGEVIDTGTGNTILGKYTGNQGGYDIRNANNHVVITDGAGNVRALFNQDGQVRIPSGVCFGTLQALTGSSTVNETAYYVLMYSLSGTATLTLIPRVGRILKIVNHSSQLIQSASSNIAAIVNGALGTQILPGTPGKWVELWCDGTNWNIIAAN
jgi:hypothetical protein